MLKKNNKIKTTGFHNTGDVGLRHTVITIKEIWQSVTNNTEKCYYTYLYYINTRIKYSWQDIIMLS